MTTPTGYEPITPHQAMPSWAKVLIGCGAGCAVVVVILVVAGVLGARWALSPGTQADTRAVAPADAPIVVRLQTEHDLQPLASLIARYITAEQRRGMSDAERSQAPSWIKLAQRVQEDRTTQDFTGWIPREATLAFVPGQEGALVPVVAANPRMLVRLFRAIFKGSATRDEHGHDIVDIDSGGAVAFVESTVVYTSDRALLPAALDSLAAGSVPPLPLAERAAGRPAGEWMLTLHADNRGEALARLLERSPDDVTAALDEEMLDLLAHADGLVLGMRLPAGDRAEVEAVLLLGPGRDERAAAAVLMDWLERMRSGLDPELSARLEVISSSEREVTARVEITGLLAAVDRASERAADRREGAHATPTAKGPLPPAEAPPRPGW